MKSKFVIFALIVLVMSLFVGAASAQEEEVATTDDTRLRRGVVSSLLDIVTEETGLTAQEIFQQVRDGATLTEVIESNGGSVQNVTEAVLAEAETVLAEAVAEERITQERADEILTNLETRLPEILNREFELRGRGERIRDRFENGLRGNALSTISEVTGLDLREIRQAVADGATLAQVIENNGGDVAVVTEELIAQATERIDNLVAEEIITQEEADGFVTNLETRIDTFLNRTWELRERPALGTTS